MAVAFIIRHCATVSNLAGHAGRLLTLGHDGKDLPSDRDSALKLTAFSLAFGYLTTAMLHGLSTWSYVIAAIALVINGLLLAFGLHRALVFSALISIATDAIRILLFAAIGPEPSWLAVVTAIDQIAWLRAAMVIGFF